MNRSEAVEMLTQSKPVLAARYGVTRLALFGSTAHDTARDNSDVDILVAFDGPATSERYFGVQFYLEDQLGLPVDLVTEKALRPELPPILKRKRCMSDGVRTVWSEAIGQSLPPRHPSFSRNQGVSHHTSYCRGAVAERYAIYNTRPVITTGAVTRQPMSR